MLRVTDLQNFSLQWNAQYFSGYFTYLSEFSHSEFNMFLYFFSFCSEFNIDSCSEQSSSLASALSFHCKTYFGTWYYRHRRPSAWQYFHSNVFTSTIQIVFAQRWSLKIVILKSQRNMGFICQKCAQWKSLYC